MFLDMLKKVEAQLYLSCIPAVWKHVHIKASARAENLVTAASGTFRQHPCLSIAATVPASFLKTRLNISADLFLFWFTCRVKKKNVVLVWFDVKIYPPHCILLSVKLLLGNSLIGNSSAARLSVKFWLTVDWKTGRWSVGWQFYTRK